MGERPARADAWTAKMTAPNNGLGEGESAAAHAPAPHPAPRLLSEEELPGLPSALRESYLALRADWLRLREMGWDEQGLLPVVSVVLPELRRRVHDGDCVAVVLVGVENVAQVEEVFGWESADALLARIADLARGWLEERGSAGILAREGPFGEEILLLHPCGTQEVPSVGELTGLSHGLMTAIEKGLRGDSPAEGGEARLAIGHSVFFANPARRFERSVVRAVHAARTMMRGEDEKARLRRKLDLADVIEHARLRVSYQPIVDVQKREIFGYEALCRGPAETPFEMADFMFAASHELELAHELDDACRKLILTRPIRLPAGRRLFVNVLPDAIVSGLATPSRLLDLLRVSGIDPRHVVLELIERGQVTDFASFRARLREFRHAGFQLAVDDVGTGFSSLRLVPEVEPDFIKVDLSLIRGIDLSRSKQGVLVTLADLAARVGADLVCEGIETEAELDVVESLGARFGQGFLLARPADEIAQTLSY